MFPRIKKASTLSKKVEAVERYSLITQGELRNMTFAYMTYRR